MAIMSGTRLGPYEILAPVGAGGMGEVYRASDPKLGREVAIKVLPEAFVRDPERLARFEREARVLASLNHSNIAAIYGFEQSGGVPFLVLEFVPGPTLAERVKAGPLEPDEALHTCGQIAQALEAAHEKGIVHRDLKPANVKITPDDKVKVLDFGLAKALAEDAEASAPSRSPTMSALATRTGVILGTAAYMSPEQVRGRAVDKRSDIWAFGCVLYELLAGKQAFSGETVSDIIAAILGREPDWTALPPGLPAGVPRLLKRCLQRDRDRRLRDIADARLELEEAGAEPVAAAPGVATPAKRFPLAWALLTALLAAALLMLGVIHFREAPPRAPTVRFQILPPDKATLFDYPTISPDGRRLAFVATVEGKTLLWVRPLDSLAAQPLPGTEDAYSLFWSPDGRFLAFFSQGKLKKVEVGAPSGPRPPQTLCSADIPGGTWSHDGTILFGNATRHIIQRVSAAGGVPVPVTTLNSPAELSHSLPEFLPDGRHFLYWLAATDRERSGVVLASVDDKPDSKDRKRLLAGGSMAVYSAGHVLLVCEGTLIAQPFDAARLELRGEPFPVAQQVGELGGFAAWAAFSASADGALAYRSGAPIKAQLAWFDRSGKELGRLGQSEAQTSPRISPDQKRVAVARLDAQGNWDIWLLELARESITRFTFHPGFDGSQVWSPDGSRIVFASNRDGLPGLYQKASSGAAGEEPLLKSAEANFPTDWSSDGRFILYLANSPKTGFDLWALPLEGDRKPISVLQTEFNDSQGQFSPNGRWIAYTSDESTLPQVYVQSFPKSGGKFQVSTNGGGWPRWRRDGKELYYLTPDRKMMAVEVTATARTFETSRPHALFQTRAAVMAAWPSYDVTADGQRFLINTELEAEGPPPITVVLNWAPKN